MPQHRTSRYMLVRIDGREDGPFSAPQLQAMCRDGLCHADESVFDADSGHADAATKLKDIDKLRSSFASQPNGLTNAAVQSAAELTRKHRAAVVHIRTPTGTGTGFAISTTGLLLTNLHVVADCTKCELYFDDGRQTPGRVVYRSDRTDLAIVMAPTPTPHFICLSQMRGDIATVGDKAVALGFPLGHGFSVTEGLVSAVGVRLSEAERQRTRTADHHWIRTSAQINGGNSGGPILDSGGRLVGMATWGEVFDLQGRPIEGMNYGIPHEVICGEIREFRRRVRTSELSVPSQDELVRESHRPNPHEELDLAVHLACKEFEFRVVEKTPFVGTAFGFQQARLVSKLGDGLTLHVDTFGFGDDGPLYLTMYCPLGELPKDASAGSAAVELLSANAGLPHWNFMLKDRMVLLRCSRQLDLMDALEIRNVIQDLTIILNRLTA